MKTKILALFGKGGAGKDTIQKYLVTNEGLNGIVSCTTRPPREYERDGKDYWFLSKEEFNKEDMLECTWFNNWCYGTTMRSLHPGVLNVGVFNPEGVMTLLADERVDVLPVLIYCDDKTRLLRSLNREQSPDCHEVCRRFLADEVDFQNLPFHYVTYDNSHNSDRCNICNLPEVKKFIFGQD